MKKNAKRTRLLVAAALLLLVCAVTIAGTAAWLTATTSDVKNTFTPSKVKITLTEDKPTNYTAKMVPGDTIDKNPTVKVLGGSEPCWLFVKVAKSGDFDSFMTYTMADGWIELSGNNGVYYREVAASAADQSFPVLKDNKVTVNTDVTQDMMDDLYENTAPNPTLTFTAYAIQEANTGTVSAAWTKIGA